VNMICSINMQMTGKKRSNRTFTRMSKIEEALDTDNTTATTKESAARDLSSKDGRNTGSPVPKSTSPGHARKRAEMKIQFAENPFMGDLQSASPATSTVKSQRRQSESFNTASFNTSSTFRDGHSTHTQILSFGCSKKDRTCSRASNIAQASMKIDPIRCIHPKGKGRSTNSQKSPRIVPLLFNQEAKKTKSYSHGAGSKSVR